MFWGLVVKPNKKYTSRVKKDFHVSQAVLDISCTNTDKAVKLILQRAGEPEYILCVLGKSSTVQVALNLNFAKDDEITFLSVGGTIHLSGFTDNDQMDDISEDDEEEDDSCSDTGDKDDESSDMEDEDEDEDTDGDEESDDEEEDDEDVKLSDHGRNSLPNGSSAKDNLKKNKGKILMSI